MDVKLIKQEGLLYHFKITVPSKDIEEKVQKKLESVASDVKIAGFRPGKVPLAILEKRYGDSARSEILEDLVSKTSDKVLEEHQIKPALAPQYEVESYEKNKPLVYSLKVDALPEIKAIDVKKLKLKRYAVKVEDAKVQETLESIAKENRDTQPISKPRKAKDGDVVIIDFEATVEGKKLPQGSAEGYRLELGSGHFIPGFESGLVGAEIDKEKVLTLHFPENYAAKELSGKEAIFRVTIKEIHEFSAPAVTEDLAKRLGIESLDQLKANVVKHLEGEYKDLARDLLKQQAFDEFLKDHNFDVPKGMVEIEMKNIFHRLSEEVPQQDRPAYIEKNKEAWHKEYLSFAISRVRLGLILAEIAKKNKIELEDRELSTAIIEKAKQFPGQEQQVMRYFLDNKEAMASIRAPLLEEKIIDYIIREAQVTDLDIDAKSFLEIVKKELEDEEPATKPSKSKKTCKHGEGEHDCQDH